MKMTTRIKRLMSALMLCCSISILVVAPGRAYATETTGNEDQTQENSQDVTDDQEMIEAVDEETEYDGELNFNLKKLSLQEGEELINEALLSEENHSGEKVAYKSSNKKIVTITNQGVIEAVHYGEATITATLGMATASCKVTVSKDVKITISAAGDVTLSSDIKQPASVNFFTVYNKQKKDAYFFKNVKSIFEKDDLTIVNFEGTLSNKGSRVEKQWAFRGKPSYIDILTEGSVEAVAFANNHVRDYGDISYSDTVKSFDKAGVIYSSDSKVGIYEAQGIKIGMISIQETNRSDYKTVLRKAIKAMKKKEHDLLIVSFHWGIERTSRITGIQKELSRIAIKEGGADLVLGHHPHVLQPIEKYKNAYIVYSLGNFCFGGNTNPPDKDTMIYQQTFNFHNDELVPSDEVSIIPCSVSSITARNNYQPTPSAGSEKKRILNKINGYSKQFGIKFDKNGKVIANK
jgi:poly-gamma-glutamate synthesis protein (capsule biosynthesis protein)